MRGLGTLLLIAGIIGAIYFFLFFDTSVAVSAGDFSGRVNNIGLMSDRQNGLIASVGSAIVGTLTLVFASSSEMQTSVSPKHAASDNLGKKKRPFCAEMIQAEAVVCRFCNRELASASGLKSVSFDPKPFKASVLDTWDCTCGKSNDEGGSRCSCGRGNGGEFTR